MQHTTGGRCFMVSRLVFLSCTSGTIGMLLLQLTAHVCVQWTAALLAHSPSLARPMLQVVSTEKLSHVYAYPRSSSPAHVCTCPRLLRQQACTEVDRHRDSQPLPAAEVRVHLLTGCDVTQAAASPQLPGRCLDPAAAHKPRCAPKTSCASKPRMIANTQARI